VETKSDGITPNAIITTRYEGGQAIVQRQKAVTMDMSSALGSCGALKK
jgi:hypothetical protein